MGRFGFAELTVIALLEMTEKVGYVKRDAHLRISYRAL